MCECKILSILSNTDTDCIKNLLSRLGKKAPAGNRLAIVENIKDFQCADLHSWGYSHYCSNGEVVSRYLKITGMD